MFFWVSKTLSAITQPMFWLALWWLAGLLALNRWRRGATAMLWAGLIVLGLLGFQAVPDALDGADCLAIVTEWGDFRRPDFDEVASRLKAKVIFDGRNLYSPSEMRARGFVYHSIGKVPVTQG